VGIGGEVLSSEPIERTAMPETYMGSQVLAEIFFERRRQLDRYGYDAVNDANDAHVNGQMAMAACYMAYPIKREDLFPYGWDINEHSYRRGKKTRERLVVAAAFIVAEIERLDRMEGGGDAD
jgi:hypothetical protein